jgi:DNA-binding response OmpR family regulator
MGKMLLLSFENSEDDVISEILSILENKQMKICENRNIKKCLEFQGLTINAEKRLAVKGNKEIEFTFTEFEILLLLAQNAGMVFSKEKIYNIVMSHISNLREKIEDNPSKPIYIQNVWGVGYRFNKNLSSGL